MVAISLVLATMTPFAVLFLWAQVAKAVDRRMERQQGDFE